MKSTRDRHLLRRVGWRVKPRDAVGPIHQEQPGGPIDRPHVRHRNTQRLKRTQHLRFPLDRQKRAGRLRPTSLQVERTRPGRLPIHRSRSRADHPPQPRRRSRHHRSPPPPSL